MGRLGCLNSCFVIDGEVVFKNCRSSAGVYYRRSLSKKIQVYRHIVHGQVLFRCISGIYGQWVVSAVSRWCMRTFSVGISRGISFRILIFPTAASDSLTLTSGGKFSGLAVDSAGTRLLPQSSSTYFPTSLFCSAPDHHNYVQTATSGYC